MKKSLIVFFIIFLISFTVWVKNSSKNLEDEIFIVQENLRELKKELGDTKLEFDYLSSAEKLLPISSIQMSNINVWIFSKKNNDQKNIFKQNVILILVSLDVIILFKI